MAADNSGAGVRKAGVIGWPIAHSRSPLIHNYWLQKYGLSGSYEKIPVRPEALGTFIADARGKGLVGFNVTVPHKVAIMDHLEVVEDAAQQIGAVNTVYLDKNNKWVGGNTDWIGFADNLRQHLGQAYAVSGTAVVLGAGGAARGVLYALLKLGAPQIVLCNRSRDRAAALARDFTHITVVDWATRNNALSDASLLVNTTSLGMTGQPPFDLDISALPVHAIVNDLVYAPLHTELLSNAKARGLKTVDGLGMLLHQAVPGFNHWFGKRPEVTSELRQLVEEDLKEH